MSDPETKDAKQGAKAHDKSPERPTGPAPIGPTPI